MELSDTAAVTDVGRTREHNEDNHLLAPEMGLLAVADGMGGLEHGEVASATAVSTVLAARAALRDIVARVDHDPTRTNRATLGSALEQVTDIASNRIQQVLQGSNSGTTLVLAAMAGGHLVVANTGDSRAYLFRDGKIRILTDDHTVAAARLRAGLMTQEEHDASPYQHMLYQALGTAGEVNPDLFDEPLAMGDIVMLCSDGLNGPVSDDTMEAILEANPDLEDAGQALIDAANAAGGPDNITVVLARSTEGPPAEVLNRDRETLHTSAAMAFLEAFDLRILRHYLDFVVVPAGKPLDHEDGLHLVLSGAAVESDQSRGPGDATGVASFAGRSDAAVATATEDLSALVLSRDAYEVLERRRPQVAARLLRGLLSLT
jgi:PPM family protein phosphatase